MKIESKLPSKRLLEFCQKNSEKIRAIGVDSGFSTATGMAYDVLMEPGWSISLYGDHMHTIIEPRANNVIAILRTAQFCGCRKKDCCCCNG